MGIYLSIKAVCMNRNDNLLPSWGWHISTSPVTVYQVLWMSPKYNLKLADKRSICVKITPGICIMFWNLMMPQLLASDSDISYCGLALFICPWFLHLVLSSVLSSSCSCTACICPQASPYLAGIWNPYLTPGSCLALWFDSSMTFSIFGLVGQDLSWLPSAWFNWVKSTGRTTCIPVVTNWIRLQLAVSASAKFKSLDYCRHIVKATCWD